MKLMFQAFAMCLLASAAQLHAQESSPAEDDPARVARFVIEKLAERTETARAAALRQGRIVSEIRAELELPEPDVAKIRALRAEERATGAEALRLYAVAEKDVLDTLSDEDFLLYLRTRLYAPPPPILMRPRASGD